MAAEAEEALPPPAAAAEEEEEEDEGGAGACGSDGAASDDEEIEADMASEKVGPPCRPRGRSPRMGSMNADVVRR